MTFALAMTRDRVDANVFVYAVGNPHPLKSVAQAFSETSVEDGTLLCTSLIGLVQDKICVTNPPRRSQ
jgi:hypothetical protein